MSRYLKEIAGQLVKRLKSQGFIVQRYDAYSTNSIYLKLDYGVANSIRISDHKGKFYLKYRFNLLLGATQMTVTTEESGDAMLERRFYPPSHIELLINDICKNKAERLKKYGEVKYFELMEKEKGNIGTKQGFFSKAQLC